MNIFIDIFVYVYVCVYINKMYNTYCIVLCVCKTYMKRIIIYICVCVCACLFVCMLFVFDDGDVFLIPLVWGGGEILFSLGCFYHPWIWFDQILFFGGFFPKTNWGKPIPKLEPKKNWS